jgi:two-component system chemotaxis response regulator CheB
MFRSVADIYGSRVLGVVLTGMGRDGLMGSERIREAGGQVLAQDEASSVVWGMPGLVVRAGLADKVLPLDQMAAEIIQRARRGRTFHTSPREVAGTIHGGQVAHGDQ